MSTDGPLPGTLPSNGPPTCEWHPERETYIQCTRCGRSICPDCMNSAAVGFQCPRCVSEGRARTREARTVFGGQVARGSVVTITLIVVNVVAFIGQYLYGFDRSIQDFGQISYALTLQGEVIGVAAGEYYRLVTSMFMHSGITHIAFNMLALWVLGPTIEALFGRTRFALLYLLSGLGGSVATYVFAAQNVFSIGASGAVFGLMGAVLVASRRLKQDVKAVLILIGLNVAIGFTLPNINYIAHFGGLVTGALVAAAFAYLPLRRRDPDAPVQEGSAAGSRTTRSWVQAAAVTPLVLLMLVAIAVRTQQLTGL
jgi:membrane associated rhomboid family serine protease